jgi:hypothetical protein
MIRFSGVSGIINKLLKGIDELELFQTPVGKTQLFNELSPEEESNLYSARTEMNEEENYRNLISGKKVGLNHNHILAY